MENKEKEFDKLVSKICNCVISFNSKNKRASCFFDIAAHVNQVSFSLYEDKEAKKEVYSNSFYTRGVLGQLDSAKIIYEELKRQMKKVKSYYN